MIRVVMNFIFKSGQKISNVVVKSVVIYEG